MSNTPANEDDPTEMVTQSKNVYAAVKSTPFIVNARCIAAECHVMEKEKIIFHRFDCPVPAEKLAEKKRNASHQCEFFYKLLTKTGQYSEICMTCGSQSTMSYFLQAEIFRSKMEKASKPKEVGEASKPEKVGEASEMEKASKPKEVGEASKPKKVGEASKMEKASKMGKVVKSKKPEKAIKKAAEVDDFHKKLFKDYPLFLPFTV